MGEKDYWKFGMSEYAIRAYTSGLVPASKIKGVPAALVKKFCIPKESHITSRNFNKTNFYSPYEVRAIFGLEKRSKIPVDSRAVEALTKWTEETKNPKHEVFYNCIVQWVEHLGRVHSPQAITRKERASTVEVIGRMATITFEDGRIMRKRIMSKGFRFWVDHSSKQNSQQLSFLDRLGC